MKTSANMIPSMPDLNRSKIMSALSIVLLAGVLIAGLAGPGLAAGKLMKDGGTMTSVESDGLVMIDGKGYEISPSARILDSREHSAYLREFGLPTRVYFEYERTPRGSVITLIKELPQ